MAKVKHKLTDIKLEGHGWTALCTCGKWACVAPTARAVRKDHRDHVKLFKELNG